MNNEKMLLKDFIESEFSKNMFNGLQMATELIDLETIERKLNLYYGIKFEIYVVPAVQEEGRFYGKGIIDAVAQEKNKNGKK